MSDFRDVKGKVAIVSPNFKTKERKEFNIDMYTVAKKCGFEILLGPILDAEPRHYTRREIYLLEAKG